LESEGVTVEIVILAMIAAFLGLRLYSVLGRRAEHEEEAIPGRIDNKTAGTPAPRQPVERQQQTQGAAQNATLRPRDLPSVTASVERGLRAIAAADRHFDAHAFLEGARSAYRMVLEAFWRGDKDELNQLCDRDVYEGFAAAIDARLAAGESLDNRLVRIEEATISSASFDAPVARVTVRFRADIAAVTRDAQGHVIAGSLDDAVETIDIWSFSRNVASSDPDWLLDETDEG
jgi:predicted lipid-binding transport protein (Tim44 family)